MTLYERICCYVSPAWYKYQNILDEKYDFCPAKIKKTLPLTVTDSYFGRLLSLAIGINEGYSEITFENFDSWFNIISIMNTSEVISAIHFSNIMKVKYKRYLNLGFSSEWIGPFLDVYKLQLYTANQMEILNKPCYLNVLNLIYDVKNTFKPVAAWFKKNPDSILEKSSYVEVENA